MLRIYILLLLYWGLSIAVPLLTVDHAASPFVADIGGRSNVHNSFRALNDRSSKDSTSAKPRPIVQFEPKRSTVGSESTIINELTALEKRSPDGESDDPEPGVVGGSGCGGYSAENCPNGEVPSPSFSGSSSGSSSGLSSGAIAGAVIGSIAGVLILYLIAKSCCSSE